MEIIRNNFGSKKGLLNSVKFKLLFLLGKYRKYQQIDFEKVTHLVFICSGNICRSSLAEYVAKSMGLSSESFGLHCRGGDKADQRAIDFASQHSLDMSSHKTRNIKDYVAKQEDLIIAMEPSHLIELEQLGYSNHQLTTLAVWGLNTIYLHDPFNTSAAFFDHCEDIVVAGVEGLKNKITQACSKSQLQEKVNNG